jgi:hypothetical protein
MKKANPQNVRLKIYSDATSLTEIFENAIPTNEIAWYNPVV